MMHLSSSFSYRKVYGYVALILMVLVMSWEYQKVDAALHTNAIPEEAIRLRILANSDSASDQFIKAKVRDAVVEMMNGWVDEPMSIDEARVLLASREEQLQQVVADTLSSNGYQYGFDTEIGQVEFPTKMYGQVVYPAGEYEALLITLGKGEGRNWWCVLFPPLCFTDAVAGEATSVAKVSAAEEADAETVELQADAEATEESAEIEVKFFIVELLEDLGAWFISLFA